MTMQDQGGGPPCPHRQVGQYEPRRQSARRARRQAAQALDPTDWDIEMLEMHHNAQGRCAFGHRSASRQAAAKGRDIDLARTFRSASRDGHTGARERARSVLPRCAAAASSAIIRCSSPAKPNASTLSHRADDRSHLRAGRHQGGALGERQEARSLFDMLDVLGLLPHNDSYGDDAMSGTLVLVRHGQSEWNLKNLFTGWKDPGPDRTRHPGSQ